MHHAARKSILSKRWRFLWNYIPHLKLDAKHVLDIIEQDIKANENVDRWLSVIYYISFFHQAPLVSSSITVSFFEECCVDFDNIFLFLRGKGIKELTLNNMGDDTYLVSDHIFSCQSLEEMDLQDCEVRPPPSFKEFGCLKALMLRRVNVTDGELEHLLSCCPVLESRHLFQCPELANFKITSQVLSSFALTTRVPVHISLKDAPSLRNVQFRFSCDHEVSWGDSYGSESEIVDDIVGENEEGKGRSENETRKLVCLLKDLTHVKGLCLEIGDRFARCFSRDELPKSLPSQCWLLNLKLLSMDLSLLDAMLFLFCCSCCGAALIYKYSL